MARCVRSTSAIHHIYCEHSRLVGSRLVWHRFRDGPLVDGPVALLALPVSNPTSPGIICVSRRIDRFGGSRGVGMVGVLSARHIPRDRTSGIPVASLARPAGTWLSPISRRAGPVALDARKVSRIAETASTPLPVKRTTLSRSGMPSIGQRPSKICTLAGAVPNGPFSLRGRQLFQRLFCRHVPNHDAVSPVRSW